MGLKLRDLGGPDRVRSLDLDLIGRDLRESGIPAGQTAILDSRRLQTCARVLLALDDSDERCEAVLLVRYGLCDEGLFSIVDALSAPTPRGDAIVRRMVGWLLTRLDIAPGNIGGLVVHRRNEGLQDAVAWVATQIPEATLYPSAVDPVVSLHQARFAQMLTQAAGIRGNVHRFAANTFGDGHAASVLDSRSATEADLDALGRKMFRSRPRAAEQRKPNKTWRVARASAEIQSMIAVSGIAEGVNHAIKQSDRAS
jgi:hypothetical protein